MATKDWEELADGSWVRSYGSLAGRVSRTVDGRRWSASLGGRVAVRGAGVHDTLEQAMRQVEGMADARGLLGRP